MATRDGSHWTLRVGGSWSGGPDGYDGAYRCVSGPCEDEQKASHHLVAVLAKDGRVIDHSTAEWTVLVGELGSPDTSLPPPRREHVTTVWFLANASAAS